jgi:hypothetical protein
MASSVASLRGQEPDSASDTFEAPEVIVEAKSKKGLAVGSWLNSPPDREAVAFDAYFNRLYFDAEGKVVGRYNRLQKKFQAGDFRPAQWHSIAAAEPVKSEPAQSTAGEESPSVASEAASPGSYPIVPYPREALPPPAPPEKPKPAEIFRRGRSSAGGFNRSRAKVIETIVP